MANVRVLIGEKDGVEYGTSVEYTLLAADVPFDNTGTGFTATNVQDAITEVGAGASPGFSFSRPGTLNHKVWLNKAGGVTSNRAGVAIFIDNPVITKVACTTENLNTYDITVYEHSGDQVNLVVLGTVSVVNERTHIFDVSWSATKGKQLAVRITDGSAKNIGVDLQLKGNN